MKIFILTILFVSLCCFASSQVNVSDMQIPDAPGFVLADKAPSSVDKPTTPRAFGISIYSLQQGGALQATPYWYFQHKTLDQSKFLNRQMPLWETFNISVATFKTDSTSNLSAGFKVHLFRIYSKKNKADAMAIIAKSAVDIAGLNLPADEEKGNGIMKKYADQIAESISKPVFRLEFATAYIGSSANNSFKSLSATKAGAWLNASFSPYKSNLIITALSRYSWVIGSNPKIGKDTSFIDYGLSVSFQKKNFDLALEFLNRHDFSQTQNYNRLAFVINYEISDEITLVSSLGKNFTDVDNIFTVFGAKFGISQKRKKL